MLSSTFRNFFAALTAAICLLAAANARAEIIFCNGLQHEVWVAIAYPQPNGSFISRG